MRFSGKIHRLAPRSDSMNKDEILKLVGFSDEFIKCLNEFNREITEIPQDDFSSGNNAITVFDSGTLIIDKPFMHAASNMIVHFGTSST